MARRFNNSSDFITLSTSTQLRACVFGTLAAVVSRASNTSWDGIFSLRTSFDEEYLDLAPSSHATNRALWLSYGSSQAAPTIKVDATDGWVLVVVTKATGSATPRYHRYSFTTGTWSHENGAGTVANGVTPNTNMMIGRVGSDWFHGDIDVVGAWSTALSDTDVESLATSLTAWDSLSPAGMWVLDQASTSDPVNDRTGNGSNQTAITGTTVVAGSPLTAAGAATLTPDDASHAHAATSPTLTQHHALSVDAAQHGHTASSPTLAARYALTVDAAAHQHAATSPDLTQHHQVSVEDAGHAHTATSAALTQHHLLDPDPAAHAHQATSPALVQHHVLAVDDATHGHSAGSPTLEPHEAGVVSPASTVHAHTATSPTLTQHHTLVVDGAAHLHVVTSAALAARYALSVDSTAHAHAATSPVLTVVSGLVVDSTIHAHAATSPALTQHHVLAVADALHAHAATSPLIRLGEVTAPPWRTLTILAEDRTLLVPAEDRTVRITP